MVLFALYLPPLPCREIGLKSIMKAYPNGRHHSTHKVLKGKQLKSANLFFFLHKHNAQFTEIISDKKLYVKFYFFKIIPKRQFLVPGCHNFVYYGHPIHLFLRKLSLKYSFPNLYKSPKFIVGERRCNLYLRKCFTYHLIVVLM